MTKKPRKKPTREQLVEKDAKRRPKGIPKSAKNDEKSVLGDPAVLMMAFWGPQGSPEEGAPQK